MRDVIWGLLAGIILGYCAHAIISDRKIANMQRDQQTQEAADLKDALSNAKKLQDDSDALRDQLAAKDKEYTKQLQDAHSETNTLRDCIDNGSCGLRVQAKCPASATKPATQVLPGPATPASVGNDAGPELTADARQAYYSLRDGIATVTKQLAYCQAAVTAAQQQR